MLATGNQLRAAMALAAMDRDALAARSGVGADAIEAMEKYGAGSVVGPRDSIKAIVAVLEGAGIEFLDHGRPGVRLKFLAADRREALHATSNDEWPEADA